MKKLKLKALSLGAKEILNREQLKGIYGGFDGSGDGGGDPGGPVGAGCQNGGPVLYHCSCRVVNTDIIRYYDCCVEYNNWQCFLYSDTVCPGMGSLGCIHA